MEEILNDLLNYKGYKIYQRNDGFNYSLDSVLLANFVTINKKVEKIVDLGCGNAPIPIILTTKTDAKIIGVEIQEISCNLAVKSVKYNLLDGQIEILHRDFKNIHLEIGHDAYDAVVANPPYFKIEDESKLNQSELKSIARHEIHANLNDVVYTAKTLLKNNGYFAMVHRPERLVEIIETMKSHNIEPKRLKFIYPKLDKAANLILIEGRKNGNIGLTVESPLYIHLDNGEYTAEIKQMFE